MERRRKEHLTFLPMARGASYSHQGLLVFAFITRTIALDLTCLPTSTARGRPCIHRTESNPGKYDREVFLTLKEFEPTYSRGGDMAQDFLSPAAKVKGLKEIGESHESVSCKRQASWL